MRGQGSMGDMDRLGDGLRWLRKKADISQTEMASALGVTQPTYLERALRDLERERGNAVLIK